MSNKTNSENSSKTIHVALAPSTWQLLRAQALAYGLSVNAYARKCLEGEGGETQLAIIPEPFGEGKTKNLSIRLHEDVIERCKETAEKKASLPFAEYLRRRLLGGPQTPPPRRLTPVRSGERRRPGRPRREEYLLAGSGGVNPLAMLLLNPGALAEFAENVFTTLHMAGVEPGDTNAVMEILSRVVRYEVTRRPVGRDGDGGLSDPHVIQATRPIYKVVVWSARYGNVEIHEPPEEARVGLRKMRKAMSAGRRPG